MTRPFGIVHRAWRCQAGATAVEFALVGLPLLLLVLGIIEFGRAFYVRNELSYAADFGARRVLIGQVARDATDSEAQEKIESAVREKFSSGDPSLLEVAVGKETVDGIAFRVLSIRYPLRLLLPRLSGTPIRFELTRRIPMG